MGLRLRFLRPSLPFSLVIALACPLLAESGPTDKVPDLYAVSSSMSRGSFRSVLRPAVDVSLSSRAAGIVERSMWQAGAAAALSPLPVVDLAAGLGITSHMVLQLARVYKQNIDLDTVGRLLGELGKQLVSVAGANVAAPLAASAIASTLKTVPGIGTITGGILQ